MFNVVDSYKLYLNKEKLYVEKKYKDYIEYYDSIINGVVELCKELNIREFYDIFVLYNYLLWKGYFSIKSEMKYGLINNQKYHGYYGIEIISGRGVCLNYSEMLLRLYKKMGYESYLVSTYMKNFKIDNKIKIKRNTSKVVVKKEENFFTKIKNNIVKLTCYSLIGNHAIVLVNDKHKSYLCDPTNLCIFNLQRNLKASVIGNKVDKSISLNRLSLYLFNNISKDGCKKVFKLVRSNQYNFNNNYLNTLELCNDNKELFNNFNKKYVKRI